MIVRLHSTKCALFLQYYLLPQMFRSRVKPCRCEACPYMAYRLHPKTRTLIWCFLSAKKPDLTDYFHYFYRRSTLIPETDSLVRYNLI
jgi:hypothetical protein